MASNRTPQDAKPSNYVLVIGAEMVSYFCSTFYLLKSSSSWEYKTKYTSAQARVPSINSTVSVSISFLLPSLTLFFLLLFSFVPFDADYRTGHVRLDLNNDESVG